MSRLPQPPTIGEISLVGADDAACSGAAFELQDAARESEVVAIDGWEAEVLEGQRIIVVRGGSEGNYDDAFRAGLATAQKALDLMSMRGGNNLVIKAFDDEHLTWWVEAGEVVIRVLSLAPVRIDVPPVTATVTDSGGNIVPPSPTPAVVWHESFRYFRLSQTTDDLFDAYRNAYLALESVLSSVAPQLTNATGKVAEREGDWFKRSLAEANKILPLASFAPAGSADPVQDFFGTLQLELLDEHRMGGPRRRPLGLDRNLIQPPARHSYCGQLSPPTTKPPMRHNQHTSPARETGEAQDTYTWCASVYARRVMTTPKQPELRRRDDLLRNEGSPDAQPADENRQEELTYSEQGEPSSKENQAARIARDLLCRAATFLA